MVAAELCGRARRLDRNGPGTRGPAVPGRGGRLPRPAGLFRAARSLEPAFAGRRQAADHRQEMGGHRRHSALPRGAWKRRSDRPPEPPAGTGRPARRIPRRRPALCHALSRLAVGGNARGVHRGGAVDFPGDRPHAFPCGGRVDPLRRSRAPRAAPLARCADLLDPAPLRQDLRPPRRTGRAGGGGSRAPCWP